MSRVQELLELGWVGEQFDMQIKQGAHYGPYRFEFTNDETGEPFSLEGGSIHCEIRKKGLDTGEPIATPIIQLVAPNAFTLHMTPEQTAAIPAGELRTDKASAYTHDIFLTDSDGHILPLYHGNVFCFRQVTKGIF